MKNRNAGMLIWRAGLGGEQWASMVPHDAANLDDLSAFGVEVSIEPIDQNGCYRVEMRYTLDCSYRQGKSLDQLQELCQAFVDQIGKALRINRYDPVEAVKDPKPRSA